MKKKKIENLAWLEHDTQKISALEGIAISQ